MIITARESVPVLQARRAQEAAAKELAEKKRRHVYQNVNGGAGPGAPMDDSSDSENYAKVIDPVGAFPAPSSTGAAQRHSTPATLLATANPSSAGATGPTNGWVRREHTYSTVDGDEQLYSEVPDDDHRRRTLTREPIDPPPPPEAFAALLNPTSSSSRPRDHEPPHRPPLQPPSPHFAGATTTTVDPPPSVATGGFSPTSHSSTSPPHVTSVFVAQDEASKRSKLDQAMTELNAEPPYTTIVDPVGARLPTVNAVAEVADPAPSEEPPYTQIPSQSLVGLPTHRVASPPSHASPPRPLPPPQDHRPTSHRVSQPLPQRPSPSNHEEVDTPRSEESPYTAITSCTSGMTRNPGSPASEDLFAVESSEEDGRSVITVVHDVGITDSPALNYASGSGDASGVASGHVTKIEISAAHHTVHGDL